MKRLLFFIYGLCLILTACDETSNPMLPRITLYSSDSVFTKGAPVQLTNIHLATQLYALDHFEYELQKIVEGGSFEILDPSITFGPTELLARTEGNSYKILEPMESLSLSLSINSTLLDTGTYQLTLKVYNSENPYPVQDIYEFRIKPVKAAHLLLTDEMPFINSAGDTLQASFTVQKGGAALHSLSLTVELEGSILTPPSISIENLDTSAIFTSSPQTNTWIFAPAIETANFRIWFTAPAHEGNYTVTCTVADSVEQKVEVAQELYISVNKPELQLSSLTDTVNAGSTATFSITANAGKNATLQTLELLFFLDNAPIDLGNPSFSPNAFSNNNNGSYQFNTGLKSSTFDVSVAIPDTLEGMLSLKTIIGNSFELTQSAERSLTVNKPTP